MKNFIETTLTIFSAIFGVVLIIYLLAAKSELEDGLAVKFELEEYKQNNNTNAFNSESEVDCPGKLRGFVDVKTGQDTRAIKTLIFFEKAAITEFMILQSRGKSYESLNVYSDKKYIYRLTSQKEKQDAVSKIEMFLDKHRIPYGDYVTCENLINEKMLALRALSTSR